MTVPASESAERAESQPGESADDLTRELFDYEESGGGWEGDDEEPATAASPESETEPEPEAKPSGEGEPAAAAAAPAQSIMDMVLPDDPSLPESYRGKLTVKQLLENERNLVRAINERGRETNVLRSKLEVQNALLDGLKRAGIGPEAEKPAPEPTEEEIWARYGITNPEEDVIDHPRKVLAAMRAMVRDEIVASTKPVFEEVQSVRAETTRAEAESAAQNALMAGREVLARAGMQISEEDWIHRSPEVAQLISIDYQRWVNDPAERASRPNPARDPIAYAAAYQTVAKRWGAGAAQAAPVRPAAPATVAPAGERVVVPVTSNPPHETRSTGAVVTSEPKISSSMEREIREWAEEWKMPVEEVRAMYLEVEKGKG